jgi:hypothetical protein
MVSLICRHTRPYSGFFVGEGTKRGTPLLDILLEGGSASNPPFRAVTKHIFAPQRPILRLFLCENIRLPSSLTN